MITRRDVMVAGVAAGTTGVVLLTPWGRISRRMLNSEPASTALSELPPSGLGKAFDHVLINLEGTGELGQAYLASRSPAPNATQLAEALGRRLGSGLEKGDAPEVLLGRAIRNDFTNGDLCELDGWQLSRTECELAALRWQLHGAAPAPGEPETDKSDEPASGGSATIVEVTNWGPRSTEQGSKFNEQPDGHSGLWFVAAGVPEWVKVRIDGTETPTTISEKGFTSGLFGAMQDRILATPGRYLIELYDPMRDVAQTIGELEVRPYAERAVLEDGTQSDVFCPVERWGPDHTIAGEAANVQPDGSQGMWFILPCAPRKVQLVFGEDRLPGTRTDTGVTCRVPLALLATERTVPLRLRDADTGEELPVGDFEIRASR